MLSAVTRLSNESAGIQLEPLAQIGTPLTRKKKLSPNRLSSYGSWTSSMVRKLRSAEFPTARARVTGMHERGAPRTVVCVCGHTRRA